MKGFGTSLNAQAGGTIRSSGKSLGGVFAKAFIAGGALLAAAGVGNFLKGSIEEAREAQKTGAATTAILKATGGAAKISAAQIGTLSSSLSAKTAVDDEQIQAGANLLLTFKNVKREGSGLNDVFARATAAGLDLAAAGFGSVEGNAKQLGKALNDPIKGLSALGRSGVTFTAAQQTQIKGFVAANDLLSAQKVILGEVEKQVGGTAAATATSGEKAAVAFGNIKEQVGTALLPVIDGLFNLFLSQVPRITSLISGIGPAFSRIQSFLAPVVETVRSFLAGQGDGSVTGGLEKLGRIALFFTPLGPALGLFINFRSQVVQLATAARSFLLPIFQQVAAIVTGQVLPILRSLGAFFVGTLVPAVAAIAVAVGQRLKPIFDQLVATFRGSVLPALQQILAAFQRNLPTIKRIASAVVSVIGFFLKLAASILGKVVPVLIRLAGFIIGKVVPVLIAIVSAGIRAVGGLISFGKAVGNAAQAVAQFAKKVGAKVQEVVQFFKELPTKIKGFLAALPGQLLTIGGQIVSGLANGIRNAAGKVLAEVQGLVNKIPKKIRSIMGIASPSKVTAILGGYIGDGLAKGITSSEKKITKAIGKVLDAAKEKLSQRIDDFKSLASGVGDNLTGDLFGSFETAGDFVKNLTTVRGNLGSALADFKTLQGFGLPPAFLAKLFADGGFPLIHSLASDQGQATAAVGLFNDVQSLSGQLGTSVAVADIGGGNTLADLNATLKVINKNLQKVPDGVGDKINKGAKNAKSNQPRGKGK